MSYQEREYQLKALRNRAGNDLMLLIAICLIVFVALAFMKALWFFNYADDKENARYLFQQDVLGLFTLPADPSALANKPWTVLTSMFVHENNDVWKVFSNMFWLWSFGFILQDLTGGKKIIPVFIYGALGGMIGFILSYQFLPAYSEWRSVATLAAVPCGVMAVAVVTTLISPGYRLFTMIGGGIPLWVISVLYLVSSFLTVPIRHTPTLLTLGAAALTGLLFVWSLRRGYDWSDWMNRLFDWFTNLFNPDKPARGKDPKKELYYRSDGAPYHKKPRLTQQRVDMILDKINQQGYESLTEEEKELLKKAASEEI